MLGYKPGGGGGGHYSGGLLLDKTINRVSMRCMVVMEFRKVQ